MAEDLDGWTRPRPVRVAFLIEDGEHSSLALDGIFADCYGRWGGRFSLIAPCSNGYISDPYWRWLEAFDPDIVYSYVSLTRAEVLKIHERLSPSEYKYHPVRQGMRRDVFGFKPSYNFTPLSSLSVIFRQARYSPTTGQGAPIKILDCWATDHPSQFLADNFGTYYTSNGGSMFPPDAKTAANLTTIVSLEHQSNLQLGVPRDLTSVPDETTAFADFVARKATSLSLLSALFSPRLDIREDRWSGSFSLVVGDSFADRILFWNSRLLVPSWLDSDISCFRVTMDQLKAPEFLATLGNLLKHRNFVNNGSGGQPHISIRSSSLSLGELEEAKQLIASTKPWGGLSSDLVDGLDAIVPSERSLNGSK